MSERPKQRPEGLVLARAQKRLGLSGRRAAERAGVSDGHYRAIVSGSRSVGVDTWIPVKAPADTLARVAHALGVSPEDLEREGQRPDAAEELRMLLPSPSSGESELDERYNFKERFERIRQAMNEGNDERSAAQLDVAFRMIEGNAS